MAADVTMGGFGSSSDALVGRDGLASRYCERGGEDVNWLDVEISMILRMNCG